MYTYRGAGYKEHHYKVEKDDFLFNKSSAMHVNKPDRYHHDHKVEKDDFLSNKSSAMHMNKPDRYHHDHKAEKDDFLFNKSSAMHMTKPDHYHHDDKVEKDDFLFNKNSAMHMNKPDRYHHDYKGPNMHSMMKPETTIYGGYCSNNYPETTIYEQEEKQYHIINKYDQYPGTDSDLYYMSNGGNKGYTEHGRYYSDHETKKAPATWDCKGIDD